MVLVVKKPPADAGDIRDVVLIPALGRSPGGGHGNPLQYSYLENPMDRGDWQSTVCRVTKSRTRLKLLCMHAHIFTRIKFHWFVPCVLLDSHTGMSASRRLGLCFHSHSGACDSVCFTAGVPELLSG